jgi:hypothetical protein
MNLSTVDMINATVYNRTMICKHCEKEIECTVCADRHEKYKQGAILTNKKLTHEKRSKMALKAWKNKRAKQK